MIKRIQNKLNNDANLKELLSGSAVTFVIKITGMLLSYLVILFVSKRYGAEGVGVYGLTTRMLNSLAIFGAMGMNVSVLRYVGQFAKKDNAPAWLRQLYGHIVQFAFPFAILLGVCLYVFAEKIAVGLFENATYIPAFKIGAFAVPFFTLNLVNIEFIRGLKLLKVSEYLRSVNRNIVILILLGLSVFSYGVMDAVYALVAGLLLTFLFSLGYILRYFKQHKSHSLGEEKGLGKKELVRTSLPMMATTGASFVLAYVGTFFIEFYNTSDQVGIFNVALRLAQLVGLVLIVVNTISAPKFSELFWNDQKEELQNYIQHSAKLMFWVSLGVSVLLVLFSKWILGIFGEEFIQGTLALYILIVGQMINAATGSVGIFMNMSGHQKVFRNIMFFSIAVVLGSYVVLVPLYGIVGAAIVSVIGAICVKVIPAIYTHKKIGIDTFYNPFTSH